MKKMKSTILITTATLMLTTSTIIIAGELSPSKSKGDDMTATEVQKASKPKQIVQSQHDEPGAPLGTMHSNPMQAGSILKDVNKIDPCHIAPELSGCN